METKIYFLLHSLGIGAKYRGFRYLAYGIAYAWKTKIISFGSAKRCTQRSHKRFRYRPPASNETSAPLFPSAGPAETVICSFRFLCIRF